MGQAALLSLRDRLGVGCLSIFGGSFFAYGNTIVTRADRQRRWRGSLGFNERGCASASVAHDVAIDDLDLMIGLHVSPWDSYSVLCPFLPTMNAASLCLAMARRPISVAGLKLSGYRAAKISSAKEPRQS